MELENPVIIPDRMFFKIGDVAEIAGVKPYVLRYWEAEFPILSPGKTHSKQRLYSRKDVQNVLLIKHLLYEKRYSIEGARKHLADLKRQGSLAEARKVKVVVDAEKWNNIEQARQETHALIELCALDQ